MRLHFVASGWQITVMSRTLVLAVLRVDSRASNKAKVCVRPFRSRSTAASFPLWDAAFPLVLKQTAQLIVRRKSRAKSARETK